MKGIVCKLCQSTCTGFSLQFSTLAASWKEFDDDLLNDTHIENWGKERESYKACLHVHAPAQTKILFSTVERRVEAPIYSHFQTLFFYITTELHATHIILFNSYLLNSFVRGLSNRHTPIYLPQRVYCTRLYSQMYSPLAMAASEVARLLRSLLFSLRKRTSSTASR